MNKIVIEPKDTAEMTSLAAYLKQAGIVFKTEEEYQLQKQAYLMKEFADLLSQAPKIDIADEEIDNIVAEIRTQRYEENRS